MQLSLKKMKLHLLHGASLMIVIGAFAVAALAQAPAAKTEIVGSLPVSTTSSPAYAELLLKKTELQSELEALVLEYTEEYPRVKEIRATLLLCDREMMRLVRVKPADSARLTLALGKLMTRKVDVETELWKLLQTYKDEHPEVKRARKKVEIFENAIAEILK
jgi:uncharacterized protein involved in exopolysaccharide biosynthesis